ncbi:DUF4145 domain-containing protein [Agrobacterium sp. CNPSo 2736]|uniref:DUF4145 domain-containing protein n=1 Tax=Agrobacterium sp. CNPSo 2736 TaxID=2499627 RepID=UPI000FD8675E|nr:DUF4145 domain-containing protein [Agrobacterium sp. CNPSo 2736]RVT80207.1 DUF4145 domain-containing protein [Agrobacterium sp. CNPSo 2736]
MTEVTTQQSTNSHNGQSCMGPQLVGLARCPHCSVAQPLFTCTWASAGPTARTDGGAPQYWATYRCQSCGAIVCVQGNRRQKDYLAGQIFPTPKQAHEDLPQIARVFLQQAYETQHAPDAAAVMSGSAVDAMLKAKGYIEGSLYVRIDKALSDNLLTKGMADWAHSVRLGSNRPRHSDAEKPHVSPDEAKQSVEFAEALGNFLFVLTAKIDRGIQQAAATNA